MGAPAILNRKITHDVRLTPYPIKNTIELVFPDEIVAFRKKNPFLPADAPSSATNDDILVVADMMKQLHLEDDAFAVPKNLLPSNLHVKGAVAWRLLEVLRDQTDVCQTSFRGVLYAFRSTNIVLWRFSDSGEWQQFGDGELAIYHVSNKWTLKWTRRYDQKEMVHVVLEPSNTNYFLGAVPVSRGVMFSVVRTSQDGQTWNVMFQCRGSKSVTQSYAESLEQQQQRSADVDSDDETMTDEISSSEQTGIEKELRAEISMAGDNENMRSLERAIGISEAEYRRMVHWAFLKALARTPARPKRVGAAASASKRQPPSQQHSTDAMDTS